MLIALSLAVAPVASAVAGVHSATNGAAQLGASVAGLHHDAMTGSSDAGAIDMAGMDMSDCAKMGMTGKTGDCPCCDTKSKCPDAGACLLKCSATFVGILTPELVTSAFALLHDVAADPDTPPDWSLQPQPPPPRA